MTDQNNNNNNTTTKKKGVHFPQEQELLRQIVAVIPNLEELQPEDYEILWFSKTDYQITRAEAKMVSRDAIKCGYDKYLIDTFSEKNPFALEKLQSWSKYNHNKNNNNNNNDTSCRRGLERMVNKQHGEIRTDEQFNAIQAVLQVQDEMIRSSSNNNNNKKQQQQTNNNIIIDVEKIRKVSHKATKNARHFARMMGKADSYAASQLENNDNNDNDENATPMKQHRSSSSGENDTVCTGRDSMTVDTCDLGDDYSLNILLIDEVQKKQRLQQQEEEEFEEDGSSIKSSGSSNSNNKKTKSRIKRFFSTRYINNKSNKKEDHDDNIAVLVNA